MHIRTQILAILCLLGAERAVAQNPSVIGSGGTEGTIPGGAIKGTLGQPVIGPVVLRKTGRGLQGFWCRLDEEGAFPTSAQANRETASATIYPNPATTRAEFRGNLPPSRNLRVEVVDMLGVTRQVLLYSPHPGGLVNLPVPIEDLSSGSYLITIHSAQMQMALGFSKQ